MWAALLGQAGGETGDATCVLSVKQSVLEGNRVVGKLNNVRRLIQLLSAQRSGYTHLVNNYEEQTPAHGALNVSACIAENKGSSGTHSPWLLKEGWRALSTQALQQDGICEDTVLEGMLVSIPVAAADLIYQQLGNDARRAVLSSSKLARQLFLRAVRTLHLSAADLKRCGVEQLSRLPVLFRDLNELHLALGSEVDLLLQLRQLQRSGSRFPHLHTFALDSRLRDDTFQVVARFLVMHSSLTKLLLSHQRCSSPADQRLLATMLEALPSLKHLDLGYATSSGSSSSPGASSNTVSSSVFRRILRLRCLQHLSCNACEVPDSQLAALSGLYSLQRLSISATGSGQGIAEALAGLSKLTRLELTHPTVSDELLGCIGSLGRLQVLAVGLCPKLTDAMMPEVAQLQSLQKLTVPFPLSAQQLRLLSRLPQLHELFTWRHLELDVLGPSHEPLHHVTRLVAGSIHGGCKALAAWFPAVEAVCLKRCSDLAASSLRECFGLQELLAGECGQLTDEGFSYWKELKGLQRLQLEGASQLTDAAFAAVFSTTMPALQHISISGCPAVSDMALQLLTVSCRRLANISLSSCRQLTDKTLKRLAHCEHLTSVSLKGCRGFTAEGIAALAAAPHMKSVAVNGCIGVRSSLCKGYRPGVKVRVEDRL